MMEGLSERSVPYNVDAERSVLGAILIHRDAIISVAPWLHPEDFYREAHAWIYEAQLNCYQRREPPDLVTVAAELERQGRLEAVGNIAYLSSLVDAVPTAVHIEYYGRIVERTAVLRRLITAGGQIAGIGYEGTEGVEDALSRAEEAIFAISQRRVTRDFVPLRDVTSDYFDRLSRLRATHGSVIGVPTGFSDLDRILGGLQRSDLVILAARPTAGKTSLALSIAYNAAVRDDGGGVPLGIFSLEMSREQLLQRLLSIKTGIDQQRLRQGHLNDDEFQAVSEAMGELSESPVFIDDTPGISITEMRSKARRLHAEEGVAMIIVDYLQLIQGRRTESRVQEISEISRSLKGLARELDVPVLSLSQLSRAVEHRTPHIPVLADLRDSGCLAGDTGVYLPDRGHYVPIRELEGQTGFRVLGVNTETWKLEPATVTNAFCTGVKPLFRLRTWLGRTVRATANHKFLTIHGWKRLDELAEGEHIALPRCLPGPSQQSMSEAESDVYWDRVKSIEPAGREPAFDLTVDGLHCFTADDIILHNSIEQDADVVMFIYREEMYDPETDKQGVAEIHIAKHRNGPVGKVYLYFRKETTRFENLERFLDYPEAGGGYPR
ncbi:MAG: replicative DNA helicase [Chloroflexia bacterium]|nr:replicative DNA helicase [Chloroflexia bacterium]